MSGFHNTEFHHLPYFPDVGRRLLKGPSTRLFIDMMRTMVVLVVDFQRAKNHTDVRWLKIL